MNQAVRETPMGNRAEAVIVSAVLIVYSIGIYFWANFRGVIGVARNDDWVYLHMAQWFAQSGQFLVESGSMTNALGLVILAQPVISIFGYSIAALQILEIFIGAIGLFFTWLLLRSFLSKFFSFIAISTLATSPFWASSSISFMTDVPAYTFQMIALWLAVQSVKSKQKGFYWLTSALIVSLFAFSIREYSISSGLAIVLFYFFAKKPTSPKVSWKFLTIAATWLFACFMLYFWRSNLGNVTQFRSMLDPESLKESSIQAIRAFSMVGLFIIPALIVSSPKKVSQHLSFRMNLVAIIPSTAFLLGMWLLFRQRGLVFGNYFTPRGSYVETFPMGIAPDIIPSMLFEAISWLGVFSVAFGIWGLTVWVISRMNRKNFSLPMSSSPQSPVLIGVWYCLASFGVLTFIPLLTNAPLFDRYFFPVLPLFAGVVLYSVARHRILAKFGKQLSIFSIVLFTFLSAVFIDSSFILDGLKWKAGDELVADGYSAQSIDAGYEWFGYHQTEIANGRNIKPIRNWWVSLYSSPEICASVGLGDFAEGENQESVIHSYEVENLIGTKFKVWSVDSIPSC